MRAIPTFYQRSDLNGPVKDAHFCEVVSGRGIYVQTLDGLTLMDGVSSFYVAGLGFCHPELVEVMSKQANELSFYVNAAGRLPRRTIELADKLASIAPVPDAYVAFASSGSEANEFALKILRMRAISRGEPERTKVLTRAGSYHGGTFVAGSMTKTGKENNEYGLPLPGFIRLTQPDYLRQARVDETEETFVTRLVNEAEALIQQGGQETFLAFVAEPVSYSAGIAPPPADYFPRMQSMLRNYGIACISDEVITGFGRYGRMFASELFGYKPDCITFAKGVTSGHFPLGGMILSGEIYVDVCQAIDAYGGFSHGSTYAGHPIGAAVALKVIEILERPDFFPQVQRKSRLMAEHISEIGGLPGIKLALSSGFSGVFEFEDGNNSGAGSDKAPGFADRCFQKGLIVRASGGGVILTPPLVTTDAELEMMFSTIKSSLRHN